MFISFPLIPFTLFLISIFTSITSYLIFRKGVKILFDKTLLWVSLYLFAHSFYILNIELFCSEDRWKDMLMPFVLGYGPLLFFMVNALRNKKLSSWEIFLHWLPFIVYFVIFSAVLLNIIELNTIKRVGTIKFLFILGVFSFVGYTLWSIFIGKQNLKNKQRLLLIVFARVLLLFLTLLFITMLFSKPMPGNSQGLYWYRMMIYSCMLISILLIFNYVVTDIFKKHSASIPKEESDVLPTETPRYERSALSIKQLQLYEQKLINSVKRDKLYLEQSLTLTSLAQYLKIPSHHLTQVFSMQVKQSFYKYINGFRIDEACELLDSPDNLMHLEAIAEKSGFNSKVSFNRQFKNLVGCTPSEYRSRTK